MKKSIALLLMILSLQIFAAGCWDYNEYENIAHVVGIGVDYNNATKEITSSQQQLITQSKQGSESPGSSSAGKSIVNAATDKSLYEALAKLQEVTAKRIFYGYLRVFIMGEESARHILKDQIELMNRTPLLRDTAYFVVCSGKAENILRTVDEDMSMASSQIIAGLLKNADASGAAFPVTIHDVAEMLAVSGWEATIPRVISTAPEQDPSEAGGSGESIVFNKKFYGSLRISGMAAFKGEQLIGWLNEKETLGFGFITGKKISAYKVSLEPLGTDTGNMLYYNICASGSKIKVTLQDNKPAISVDIKAEADLRKYYSNQGANIIDPEEKKLIEKELSASIRSDIEAALQKAQTELKSDIFGFGFAFFREYPDLWKNQYEKIWEDIYPDLPVDVNVKVRVDNTGSNIRRFIVQ
ncbi:MAG: Ger(x)C family spore germination protein [Syntrophomonas sp.]|nr:Ger(x)C family spore germination protein [Syntrophomonas sp.]